MFQVPTFVPGLFISYVCIVGVPHTLCSCLQAMVQAWRSELVLAFHLIWDRDSGLSLLWTEVQLAHMLPGILPLLPPFSLSEHWASQTSAFVPGVIPYVWIPGILRELSLSPSPAVSLCFTGAWLIKIKSLDFSALTEMVVLTPSKILQLQERELDAKY